MFDLKGLKKRLKHVDNAVTILFYDSFIEAMGDGTHDMDDVTAGVFLIELCNAYTYNAAHTQRSDWSGTALGTAFGYTNPGQGLLSITWTGSGGTTTWDADNNVWTASGGDIGPATDAIIYDDTTTTPVDAGICDIDFGASETANDTATFNINFNVAGIFTIS